MSMFIGAIMFIPLLAIAIACLLWSIGRSWPIKDRELLAKTVLGSPGSTRISKLGALVVGIAMFTAGVFALALADHDGGGVTLTLIGVAIGALFLARGALGYTSGWRSRFSAEPFATVDRKTYSPLSLALGVGFFVLVIMRLL